MIHVIWYAYVPLKKVCVGGEFPSQGYIFLSKSLAKCVFKKKKKNLKIGILGLNYRLFFLNFLFTREYMS